MKEKQTKTRAWKLLRRLVFLLIIPIGMSAQNIAVKGNVVDEFGDPIIGATVVQKNATSNGTITDLNGGFTLNVPANTTLVVSYIGMENQEVKAVAGQTLTIALKDSAEAIDEVVVIGYGSRARKDLTGSVGSISGAKLAAVPVSSAAEALQGKIAGVQVTTIDGAPGAEINIRVRGGTSVTQNNQPLYIVDGFQADNINDIPPTDIQSIDVLKDASLTAIYGSRGGNGVVIVTTKSAQQGKMRVEFNTYAQMRTLARKLDLLDSYEFVRYQLDNVINNNSNLYKWRGNFGNPMDIELYKNRPTNDWQDEIMGGRPMSYMYNVTLNGGSEKLRFNTSITHHDETGIMIGSGVRRTNVNIKINAQLSPKLKLLINPRISTRRDMGAGADNVGTGGLLGVLRYRPTNGLRDFTHKDPETVNADEEKYFEYTNPKGDMDQNYQLKHSWSFTNQASLEWSPIKELVLRSDIAQFMSFSDNNRFYGYLTSKGVSNNNLPVTEITDGRSDKYVWTNTANYSTSLNSMHNLDFLLGQEIQHKQSKSNYSSARYFPKDILPRRALNNMGLGEPYLITSEISSPERTSSFFGQAGYNYDHKYLVSATFRADGSTKFSPGNQWGYFPAVSGAWVISREPWMEDSPLIDNLKLRAAIGMAGNNNISDDMWRYQYVVNSSGGPGFGEKNLNGEQYYVNAGGSTFPNTKIKWETTITRNLALDLALFGDRLTITPELYWNTTRDMLYTSPIISTTGYSNQTQNIGQVTNKGFELTLNGTIVHQRDFQLEATLTFGMNKSRIDKLNGTDNEYWTHSSRWSGADDDYCLKVGDQLGLIYGYVYDGIYGFDEFDRTPSANYTPKMDADGNQIPVNCNSLFGTAPGRPKFKNIVDHAAGREDDVNIVDANDRVVIGNTNPDFTGGFSFNGRWKNFDFTCNFNYMVGFDVNNATAYMLSSSISNTNNYYNLLSKFNENNRWVYTNEIGERILANSTLPAYTDQYVSLNEDAILWNPADVGKNVTHSYFIEDGSFLRLQDLTIGYTFPQKLLGKLGVERLRVYFTGSNLWLLTGYSGYDPEVDIQTGLTPGMDYNRYPRSRNFLFGLNLSF
ncbi:MAG: TonB-dependent receptor [Mediterranea sp.]|nr:TonB-dependent receptor [Mediterranea sp.]